MSLRPSLRLLAKPLPSTMTNWDNGFAAAYSGLVYTPTVVELGIMIGIFALGVFSLLAGLRYLPLQPTDKTE